MQRYNELYDPYTGALELDDNGAYVLYSEAQAEIDRLRALLGKPKVLEAHELTELGWYWHKWPLQKEWRIVKVHHPEQTAGQFIGPLRVSEVRDETLGN